jgi:hypothetical protein
MRHARQDYDRIQDPLRLIPEAEPVFLLRGQDLCAPDALEAYANAVEVHHGNADVVSATRKHAEAMRKWQADHKAKMPDL